MGFSFSSYIFALAHSRTGRKPLGSDDLDPMVVLRTPMDKLVLHTSNQTMNRDMHRLSVHNAVLTNAVVFEDAGLTLDGRRTALFHDMMVHFRRRFDQSVLNSIIVAVTDVLAATTFQSDAKMQRLNGILRFGGGWGGKLPLGIASEIAIFMGSIPPVDCGWGDVVEALRTHSDLPEAEIESLIVLLRMRGWNEARTL